LPPSPGSAGLLYVTGGGTTGGTTLLANLRVDVERRAELALSRYRLGWPDRGVAAAVVRKSGARLAVASLHLPLPETERLDHVRRGLAVLRAGGVEEMFASGDMNERPSGTAWGYLEEQGPARPRARQRADLPRHQARAAHRRCLRNRRRRAGRLPGGRCARRRARQRPPSGAHLVRVPSG
jgi:endonuclease/exonuclease/phosphatase family metal-dependent hydrolase